MEDLESIYRRHARLVDRFGFDRVSSLCFGQSSFEEAFGVDYSGAYAEWSARIPDNYVE